MQLLLHYLRRSRGLALFAMSMTLVSDVAIGLNPYIFGTRIVDPLASKVSYFREHGLGSDYFKGALFGVLLIGGASMLAWLANTMKQYAVNKIIRRLGANLYGDFQCHILQLPYEDFEDQRSGETLSILQRARTDCESFISNFVNVLFTGIVSMSLVVVISWRLTLWLPVAYVSGGVVLCLVVGLLSRRVKMMQRSILEESNALAGSTVESLRNIELVKSLGLVRQEIRRLGKSNLRILRRELQKIRRVRNISSVYASFNILLHLGVIFMLMVFLFYGRITVGQLIMMQMYFYSVLYTLGEMGNVTMSYRDAEASLARLKAIFKKPLEGRPAHPKRIGPLNRFRFEKVRFQHRSAQWPALEEVSLEVRMGETIAIVGPSGSGKTTLTKLLTGLYQPTGGNIFYNDCNHAEVDLDDLRRQLGLVTQDTQLFSGSIRDNLLFVSPDATDKAMLLALHNAACLQLLDKTPSGLDTVIGEGGLKLSGGERQRLAIARSLLRGSTLLVFDEATSALDSITERENLGYDTANSEAPAIYHPDDRSSAFHDHVRRPHLCDGKGADSRDGHPPVAAQRGRALRCHVASANRGGACMGNSMIQSLWIGSGFSNNELLCMRSFLHHGQAFHLYVYEPMPGIPEGVEIRDANEIIPAARLFLDSRNSHASFADWFRLKLLFERGGWWIDLDVVCLQPLDGPDDHCFSSEMHYNRKEAELNNICIKAPAGSAFIGEMLTQAESRLGDASMVEWGAIGIRLIRDCMSRHEEMACFVQPPDVFCPLPYYDLSSLICKSEYVPAKHTKGIHLWNEVWMRGGLDKNAIYHPDSMYERLKKAYLPKIT